MILQNEDDDFPEPPQVRRLRLLVSGLMIVLILGVLAIAGTIVIRLGLGWGEADGRLSAERIALPPGDIVAVGRGGGTLLFVMRAPDGTERLLAFDDRTGAPAGATAIGREATAPD